MTVVSLCKTGRKPDGIPIPFGCIVPPFSFIGGDNTFSELLNFEVNERGPVDQSIVSLTSSLRGQLVKCFMT